MVQAWEDVLIVEEADAVLQEGGEEAGDAND